MAEAPWDDAATLIPALCSELSILGPVPDSWPMFSPTIAIMAIPSVACMRLISPVSISGANSCSKALAERWESEVDTANENELSAVGWDTSLTLIPLFAKELNVRELISGTFSALFPSISMIEIFRTDVTPFASPRFAALSVIQVPGAVLLKVFSMRIGMFFVEHRIYCRGIDHFGSERTQFHALHERQAVDDLCLRDDARIGGHESVHVGPYLKAVGIKGCGHQGAV